MATAKDYQKGHLIGVFEPFVHSLRSEFHNQYCNQCFTKCISGLRRCKNCLKVAYCDSVCQRKNWKLHRYECSLMQKAIKRHSVMPGNNAFFIYKLYSYSKSEKSKGIKESLEGVEKCYDSLMSNVEDMKKSEYHMSLFKELFTTLKRILDKEKKLDLELLWEAYGKFVTNGFFITNECNQEIGMAIYLGPSLLDHSCNFNTVCIYKGINLKLKIVADVKADQMLHLTYVDPIRLTQDRQAELQSTYLFKCTCSFCESDLRNKEMMELSSECVLMTAIELKTDTNKINFNFSNPDFRTSMELLYKWESRLGKWNINLYKILYSCMNSCIMVQNLKEAVVHAKRITDIFNHYLLNTHPNYFMHIYQVAQMYISLNKKSSALEVLNKERPMINTLYDKEDYFQDTLQNLIAQCM